MKKNLMFSAILIMAITLFATLNSWSQNSSPYWSLAGNSNANGSSKLGTTNNNPLKIFTNNAERMQINSSGRVAIGTSNAFTGQLTVMTNGSSNPSGLWNRPTPPIFMGYGENSSGNADFLLGMASNDYFARPVFFGRRTRGSLASPAVVQTNDYLSSFLCSGYDGGSFQNPASIDFYVDASPTSGHVPTRLSLVTGTNSSDRQERLKILYNGDFNFNNGQMFLDQSSGNLGVGTNTPSYKLEVESSGLAIYGYSLGSSAGVYGRSGSGIAVYGYSPSGTYGVYGYGGATGVFGRGTTQGMTAQGGTYGLYATGTSRAVWAAGGTYGVYGTGTNYGLYGSGGSYGVYGNATTYGVRGIGNYGVYGSSSSASGRGVYGYSSNNIGVYGATGDATSWAGYFVGRVYSSVGYTTSDKNLKKNIESFDNAMAIINKLKPKHYDFRDDGDYAKMQLPKGHHYGLIAQDVEEVLPGLVADNTFDVENAIPGELEAADQPENAKTKILNQGGSVSAQGKSIDFKVLNYTELIPILVRGMQEQQNEIAALRAQIEELKGGGLGVDQKALSLKGFLGQNVPNPANGNTVIPYSVPNNGTNGEIRLTDIQGRFIKNFPISGSGQLTIPRALLAAGVYNYSMYTNGQFVQTKQMIIAR